MAGGIESEQGGLPARRGEQAPRSLPEEEKGWYDRSYEELVRGFRDYLHRREQEWMASAQPPERGFYLPEELIRDELTRQATRRLDDDWRRTFITLTSAWDALAYERYEPGSSYECAAGFGLEAVMGGEETTVKLSDPVQVRIIDALTEIAGIPHQRGQTDIEVPEKLRHYHEYYLSQEYQDRVAQAQAQRYGGGSAR
jgi:hypothetical protein